MSVKKYRFGMLSCGSEVSLWVVSNGKMSFTASDYGCLITGIMLPGRGGQPEDIALGYSALDSWVHNNKSYQGALIGRYANRIANARFKLDGAEFKLDANYGSHSLHGGFHGYHQFMWNGETLSCDLGEGVRFKRRSPDGEQGYPGNLDIEVDYLLNSKNELILRYKTVCDKNTPVNLTQHVYFNLRGEGHPTVGAHRAKIYSSKYLDIGESVMPTGRILDAKGTVFDFSSQRELGSHFGSPELEKMNGGYDCAFCFDPCAETRLEALPVLAEIFEPETGRALVCRSNKSVMQLYTGCNLNVENGKNGKKYSKFSGFCLETEKYTNAPNIETFPSCILKAGETEESLTVYGFSW
ncbi:MAG: galactose mutarotase [Spirochaetaceae bacterium]|nr:galactose mutarotase [Spirochaetaceae bacterium]